MRTWIAIAGLLSFSTQAWAKPVERRLYTDRVEASSFDWNDWNRFQENYHPNYVGDDDPKTAWTEGAKGAGPGEWIRVHHSELEGVMQVRLRIRNGYQKTPSLFTRNARAKDITIKLLPDGPTVKQTLLDQSGWQEIKLTRPSGKQDGYEIVIDSVYPGTHYEDLCISDIQTFITATTADNPTFELKKRNDLLAWKKQRVDAAKLFQTASAKSLPIGAQYTVTSTGEYSDSDTKCEWNDAVCLTKGAVVLAQKTWPDRKAILDDAQKALDSTFKDWQPVVVSTLDKRKIPQVEGFRLPNPLSPEPWEDTFDLPLPGEIGYFQATQLRRVYSPKSPQLKTVLSAKDSACKKEDDKARQFVWTPKEASTKGEASPLKALLVVHCGSYEEREGYIAAATLQVLYYDHDGQLDMIVAPTQVTRLEWGAGKNGPMLTGMQRVATVGKPQARSVLATTPPPTKQ